MRAHRINSPPKAPAPPKPGSTERISQRITNSRVAPAETEATLQPTSIPVVINRRERAAAYLPRSRRAPAPPDRWPRSAPRTDAALASARPSPRRPRRVPRYRRRRREGGRRWRAAARRSPLVPMVALMVVCSARDATTRESRGPLCTRVSDGGASELEGVKISLRRRAVQCWPPVHVWGHWSVGPAPLHGARRGSCAAVSGRASSVAAHFNGWELLPCCKAFCRIYWTAGNGSSPRVMV